MLFFNYIQGNESAERKKRVTCILFCREDEDKIGLERDILANLAGTGKMFVFESNDFWQQLNTPSSVIPANKGYLEVYSKNDPTKSK